MGQFENEEFYDTYKRIKNNLVRFPIKYDSSGYC